MLTNTVKNEVLNYIASRVTYIGLVGSDDNEISGGDPAYERKPIAWNSPSEGAMTATGSITFDVPFGVTVTKVRFFNHPTTDETTGEYKVNDEVFGGQATYEIETAVIDLNHSVV